MNPTVKQAVIVYLAKINTETHSGKIIKPAEMSELQARLTIPLPDWYVYLLSTYPIAGAEIAYPRYEAKGDYDGMSLWSWLRQRTSIRKRSSVTPALQYVIWVTFAWRRI